MSHRPRHTIVLIQKSSSTATRTYYDFETKTKALDGILKIYENTLKALHPTKPTITYELSDVYAFMDELTDISALVLDPETGSYEPFSRDMLKQHVYLHLKDAAR